MQDVLIGHFTRLDSNIGRKSLNNTYLKYPQKICIFIFFNLKIIELENLVMTLTLEN